jgi:uncharacterized membrane protein (DUF485 family)
MVDMTHNTSPSDALRNVSVEKFNARLGLVLFAVYLAVYVAYVLVNAFWPTIMDRVPFAGLNVAVISGLGLIIGALLLSLLYMGLCRSPGVKRA